VTGIDWMLDLEISLVKAFRWSIPEIEQTSVESLMLFVHRLTAGNPGSRPQRQYIDQAGGWW
jgi:hypothetical protein